MCILIAAAVMLGFIVAGAREQNTLSGPLLELCVLLL